MNRIYQGRVTKVEILGIKDGIGEPLDVAILWRHHGLFQGAAN